MGLLDDLFEGNKNRFKETGDNLLDQAVKSASEIFEKPVMEKALGTINEAADRITDSLEALKDGEEPPEDFTGSQKRAGLPDFDGLSEKWNSMISAIEDRELGKYRICPDCGKVMPAENAYCTDCGAKLPEQTLAVRQCPYCGAENRYLALNCVKCGKELPLVINGKEQGKE